MERLPTLTEELERKTVEVLEKRMSQFENNEINGNEMHLVAKTAWDIVSGLVSSDISEMCAQAAEEGRAGRLHRYFVGKSGAVRVSWSANGDLFFIERISKDMKFDQREKTTNPGEATEGVLKFVAKLIEAGYVEM